jgi:antibiotic biosynthesis monooxygenase (ABM) superfamily enzyme
MSETAPRTTPDATTSDAAAPEAGPAAPRIAAPPSVHARALITWIAIFPLVAIGLTAMSPLTVDWHPVWRAFALTVIVVPLAVYVVVPRLLALYLRLRARRAR